MMASAKLPAEEIGPKLLESIEQSRVVRYILSCLHRWTSSKHGDVSEATLPFLGEDPVHPMPVNTLWFVLIRPIHLA